MGLYIFDLFGTLAFAVSGALMGVKKGMDVYGCFMLALVTGVGGGTIRDMLLSNIPFILNDASYLLVVFIAVIAVLLFKSLVESLNEMLVAADAVGLGVFTFIGAAKGLEAGLGVHGIIITALLTATGGGMLRDILANEVPAVLTREIYASACIVGGGVFVLLNFLGISLIINAVAVSVAVAGIRMFTYKKNYHLPKYRIS
ncbi:MAG: trimeric intracellular cation channel family protein [Deferribacteraceae bacterium]|nr:trimeric intracellular cation channel family protein [Deferribacteraceae bacterium]